MGDRRSDLQLARFRGGRLGEPAIAVRGLRKSFGTKEAVAGIDPEIAVVPSPVLSANGAGRLRPCP